MAFAGAVLAAGASSRMGTDKSRLEIEGRTFLNSMTSALAQGGCSPVIAVVSGDLDRYDEQDLATGVQLVENPDPSGGQISSLRCALDALPAATGLIVVLVDQGWLAAQTVAAVGHALEGHPMAVARHGGQSGHPTGFLAELFPALRSAQADRLGARAVFDAQRKLEQIAWVDVDDPGVVRNLNTPEDYRLALELQRNEGSHIS